MIFAAVVALGTCIIGYARHFMRIPEMAEAGVAQRTPRTSRIAARLRDLLLRTRFERGCFPFVWKTMLRSEAHRLVLTGVGGLALVLASQALMNAFQSGKSWRAAALLPDAIAIPFIVTFLVIIGLRMVFEIPVELRSNWIFQLMLDRDQQECASLGKRVILTVVVPLALIIGFPAYAYLEGFRIAVLHTFVVGIWAMLLTHAALVRFRKVPFTCTLPLFKQHSIVTFLSFCFGYLIYAVSIPEFEASALSEPFRLLAMVPAAVLVWFVSRALTRNATEIERKLIFEESPTRAFELLHLGD